ncbi:MAG: Minf_1886 family protein [bacterium]
MKQESLEKVFAGLVKEDPRYPMEAYLFLREALDFTMRLMSKPDNGPGRHVTGQELLEGIRQFALREFGPVTATVLHTWNISRTEDFGEMVFNLVNRGLLGKTEQDRKEDFAGGYDFHAAFVSPFLPKEARREIDPAPVRKTPTRVRQPQPHPEI